MANARCHIPTTSPGSPSDLGTSPPGLFDSPLARTRSANPAVLVAGSSDGDNGDVFVHRQQPSLPEHEPHCRMSAASTSSALELRELAKAEFEHVHAAEMRHATKVDGLEVAYTRLKAKVRAVCGSDLMPLC